MATNKDLVWTLLSINMHCRGIISKEHQAPYYKALNATNKHRVWALLSINMHSAGVLLLLVYTKHRV
jgi:hypothetical protein